MKEPDRMAGGERSAEATRSGALGRFGQEVVKGTTIYAKALMVFAVSCCLLFGALFIFTESLIIAQFEELESQQVRDELGRVVAQIERDLEHLRSTAQDWANWTELHLFCLGRNPGFPEENLNEEALGTLQLDFMGVWDRGGELLAEVSHGAYVQPKLPKLLDALERQAFLRDASRGMMRSGVMVVGGEVALTVACPVFDSTRESPQSGVFVIVLLLDSLRLDRLKPTLNSELRAIPLTVMLDNPELRQDALRLLATGIPVVQPLEEERVFGAALLRGAGRLPVAAISLVQYREMFAAGMRATRIFLVAMTVAGGGLVVVLWVVIDWNLLRRIGRMDRGVRMLRTTGEVPQELKFKSKDELGRLAISIREMSESLRQAQANYRRMFESSRDAMVVLDFPGLRIQDANPAFCHLVEVELAELIDRHLASAMPNFPCEDLVEKISSFGSFLDHEIRVQRGATGVLYVEAVGTLFGEDDFRSHLQLNLRDVSERKRFETTMRELSGKLLRLQDDERRKIARELHDSTAQNLSALEMNMTLLAKQVSEPEGRKLVLHSREVAENCSREIRTLSYLLHPPLLDEVGLLFAIRWFVEGYIARTDIAVRLSLPDEFPRLAEEKETGLFRIIQESLTNVYKHAESESAWVSLSLNNGTVYLEVGDRGRGFPSPTAGAGSVPGLGLAGMRERIRRLGGEFSIISGKSGSVVRVSLPVEEH